MSRSVFLPGRPSSSMSLSSVGYSGVRAARSPSVYGGAGGRNVRVSYASGGSNSGGFDLTGLLGGGDSFAVSTNDKITMQNLNDRLAAYLTKVRSLESANAQLERQIREWYEKQTPTVRDYSKYEAIITDLRKKLGFATQDNARIILQIDNAKLAAEDFRLKAENESALHMSVEEDMVGLRKLLDELTVTRSDLELEIEGLKEELVYLKKNHTEELAVLRANISSSTVNVEVDAAPQQDLAHVMDEIRSQYEAIADKSRSDIDAWYKGKFDELNMQVESGTETLQISCNEVSELKRTMQALEIELQSQISLKAAMEGQLGETENRYILQLNQLQAMVNNLETELSQVKLNIQRQASEYQILLNIKTRLEMEIAEYRRLLDGEDGIPAEIVVKPKPVITKRVRTVIEEMVNGEVVSRTEDLDMSVLKK